MAFDHAKRVSEMTEDYVELHIEGVRWIIHLDKDGTPFHISRDRVLWQDLDNKTTNFILKYLIERYVH